MLRALALFLALIAAVPASAAELIVNFSGAGYSTDYRKNRFGTVEEVYVDTVQEVTFSGSFTIDLAALPEPTPYEATALAYTRFAGEGTSPFLASSVQATGFVPVPASSGLVASYLDFDPGLFGRMQLTDWQRNFESVGHYNGANGDIIRITQSQKQLNQLTSGGYPIPTRMVAGKLIPDFEAVQNLNFESSHRGYSEDVNTATNEVLATYSVTKRLYGSVTEVSATLVGGVPEPATWTMMIGGFGLIGGALRRRRVRDELVQA